MSRGEILSDNGRRSKFVLETDRAEQRRVQSLELDQAFAHIMWNQTFVVVGVSFECDGDRTLLRWLNRVEDEMPVGESRWIIVNPDVNALAATAKRIHEALPGASIHAVPSTFREWLNNKVPELQAIGAFRF
jgi:hypothetical protein